MSTLIEDQHSTQRSATVFHPISADDKIAITAMRAIVEPNKGRLQGTAACLSTPLWNTSLFLRA
jgi:hypothetical protein